MDDVHMLNILYNVAMLAMLYKYAVLPYVEFTHVYQCLPMFTH